MDPFTIGLAMASTALSAYGKLSGAASQGFADQAEAQNTVSEGNITLTEAQPSLTQAQLYGINAETAKSNVGILTTQAEIAGLGEDFAYAKARLQKGRIIEQGRQTLATQRATFAGRNLDPAFGSPLVTQALTAGRIAQDLDLTDAGAAVEAADAITRKSSIINQAAGAQGQVVSSIGQQLGSQLKAGSQYERAGSQFGRARSLFSKSNDSATSGVIGAASALLSGASSMGRAGAFAGGSGGTAGTMDVGGNSYVAFGA
ncbi:hypothetical protein [Rhodopseudomonas sp. RCAM05734]|uniref:hypothetical protein n=1 Tax=Rhodopseudomonas sp. RCAM05734 TaxID=3457549 RepID=UPI004044E794